MKFLSSSLFAKLTLAASAAAVLVGCDDPDYPTPSPVTASTVSAARVLVVNASPGSQTSSITIDNVATGQSVGYLSATPAYLTVPAGQRQIGIVSPNNVKYANGEVVPGVVRQQFASGSSYTVFSTDAPTRTGTGTDLGGIRAVALSDNLAAPAVATNAKIRFVNLATSGTYGIFNSITQASLFTAAPTRASRAISTGSGTTAVNFANFTEVAAGTYTLDVRSVATTPIAGTAQPITFAAGKIYTLYVRGTAGSTATPLGISVVQHN